MEHQNLDELFEKMTFLVNRSRTWEEKSATNPGGMPNPRDVTHPMERVLRRLADLTEANLLLNMARFEITMQRAESEDIPL